MSGAEDEVSQDPGVSVGEEGEGTGRGRFGTSRRRGSVRGRDEDGGGRKGGWVPGPFPSPEGVQTFPSVSVSVPVVLPFLPPIMNTGTVTLYGTQKCVGLCQCKCVSEFSVSIVFPYGNLCAPVLVYFLVYV